MISDNLKTHTMRRDHLTEQENDDNVLTLGKRLDIAAKMVFLHPQLLSPSPHFPEWINTWLEEQTIFSEGGEDQSETSDESGEDDDSNEDEDNVDVENRDDQSDISN